MEDKETSTDWPIHISLYRTSTDEGQPIMQLFT